MASYYLCLLKVFKLFKILKKINKFSFNTHETIESLRNSALRDVTITVFDIIIVYFLKSPHLYSLILLSDIRPTLGGLCLL